MNNKISATSLVLLLVLTGGMISCKKGKKNPNACNGSSTRREVKLTIDDAANQIDTVPIITSVDSIGSIDLIDADSDTDRQPIEMKVFSITATVHKLSKHRDGDWKVKLTDGNDKFVNCEAPNMGCEYIPGARFFTEMSWARRWIQENQDDLVGKTVTVTGVAFIDIDHKYPRNAAENEIELHPILDIHY